MGICDWYDMGNEVQTISLARAPSLCEAPNNRRKRRASLLTPGSFVAQREGSFSQHFVGKVILGRGSFGRVVECEDRVTGGKFAAKIISRKSVKSEVLLDTFIREVKVLKELDHPNIMKIHEYFQDNEYFYLISDLYEGGELFDEIVRRVRFSEASAIVILKQILSGIAYIHDKGVVHRDLKPENILLEKAKNLENIKIIDFGLASYFDAKDPLKDKTGTAYYIAPEVIAGQYDNKCDIWSAGIILYILISGCPPFFGNDEREILKRVSIGKYTFKIPQFDSVSDEAKDVIRCMLFYYPSDRPCARTILDYAWMGNSSRRQKAKDKVIKFLDYRTLLANAKVLRKQSRLVQMVMLYSASKLLTSEEIALARPSFEYIDIDKDGRINRQEVTEAIKKLVNDDNHAIEATKLIFDAVDFNDDQHIEISEFLTMAFDKVVLLSKDRLRRSFET